MRDDRLARRPRLVLEPRHEAAAAQAADAGLAVVMDRCVLKEHARLIT